MYLSEISHSRINTKMLEMTIKHMSLSRLYHNRQLTGASMQNVKPHCAAVSFAAAKVITRTANNVKNMILSLLIVSHNVVTNESTDEETAQTQLVSGRTRFQKRGKTRSSNERSFFSAVVSVVDWENCNLP